MLKKTMTYTDYDGNERTEDLYFNLTKAEVAEMELEYKGGLTNLIKKIIEEQDTVRVAGLFKEIILRSYGEKSLDGKRFVKNQELRDAFTQTEAYSDLYIELLSADNAVAFIEGILPKELTGK